MIVMAAMLAAAGPVVTVDGGRIAGEARAGTRVAFRGIPFAAPPIGALRWRSPAPVRPWQGVRAATRSAPACAQLDDGWNRANAAYSAEDCLYLEVGTPTLTPARPLPVLVWIHGGSNKAGGAAGTIESSLVDRGMVVVSIAYRLGPLGFMAHPALTREAASRASGNYGLMDQQAALRWVRRNIAAFGGDPARVTIAGESAGGEDVGLHQVSPSSAGLFAQAIEESGTAGFGFPSRDLAASERLGEAIAAQAGAAHADAARLHALPVAALLAAARRIPTPAGLPEVGTIWLQTTVDGHVITEPPERTLARGGGARVPLLIGSNTREIGYYPTPAAASVAIEAAFGARAAPVRHHYGLDAPDAPDDPVHGPAALHVATDLVFTCPAAVVASARARAGMPVWQYAFGYAAPGRTVSHAGELRYVFGRAGEDGIPADAPPLQAYWANFVRAGDPNGAGLPIWPAYRPGRAYLAFAQTGPVAGTGLGDPVCSGTTRP